MQNLVSLARKKNIPLRIIGAGTNILADDRGIKGIVAKLSSPYFKKISVDAGVKSMDRKSGVISAGAGVALARLVQRARSCGFSGWELLAGIPGTLGGALIMNAGNIGGSVMDITVIDSYGRYRILKSKQIKFSYRKSSLSRHIILSARFKLIKKDKRLVGRYIDENLGYRQRTQDLSGPSAGCIFKNPSCYLERNSRIRHSLSQPGFIRRSGKDPATRAKKSGYKTNPSAAYLIERSGLKGSSFGDAVVSLKHANFIINKGKANSADILRLMTYITRQVKKRFKFDLEPEIKIWRR